MKELKHVDVPSTFTFKRLFEKEILDETLKMERHDL